MVDIQRILCPIDFSDASRHALEHAAAAARWHEARITVVHVDITLTPRDMTEGFVVLPPVRPGNATEAVRRFCTPVLIAGSFEIVVTEGNAAKEIVRLAERMPADLLVMGTHGREGFERLFLGSVTEKVLRTRRPGLPIIICESSHPVYWGCLTRPYNSSSDTRRALGSAPPPGARIHRTRAGSRQRHDPARRRDG